MKLWLAFIFVGLVAAVSLHLTTYGCIPSYWSNGYWQEISYKCHFPNLRL